MKTQFTLWLSLAAAALALAGCGAGGNPKSQVVGAAKKTLATHWVRYEMTFKRPRLFDPRIQIVGGRSAYNLEQRLGYEFLNLQKPDGGSQTLWLDLTPTSLLVDPDPPPAGVLPPGKVWVSIPLAEAGVLAAEAEGFGPELPLDEIAWAAQTVTHVGSSVQNHLPADQYRVTVDLRKARAAAERLHRDALAAAITSELRASASPRLSLDVWVNGPGYVSRVDHALPGARLGTVSLMFTSYRVAYTGTLPPSSEIVALPGLGRSVWSVVTGS